MKYIQAQKKAMICWKSEGSTITDYNNKFMDLVLVSKACGGTFQLPVFINISLVDNNIRVVVGTLETTVRDYLNNKVRKWLLVFLFINNSNRRV